MKPTRIRPIVAALLAVGAGAACGSARAQSAQPSPQPQPAPPAAEQTNAASIARAQADSARHPWTAADAKFMTHMIGHHAQAIVMANWAPTHDASPAIRILAARIINAQQDEIATMQRWLRDRRQPVPDAVPGMKMVMDGVEHVMLMPGMLTEAQMAELDAARGKEFDRLFLTYMIQHHRGATSMVSELFGTWGAGQDETIFKFASDVNVDQTTEIERMQRMLADLVLGGGSQ
jgi:uncharacterized protein (DUF305 family)